MPPRISRFPCLKALESALPPTNGQTIARSSSLRTFSSSTSHEAKAKAGHQRKYRDPYIVAQARARKAANLSKQEALRISRQRALGDPVRGVETEFVRSFDTAQDTTRGSKAHLNNFLTKDEVDETLKASKDLVEPAPKTIRDFKYDVRQSGGEKAVQAQLDEENAATKKLWEEAHGTVQEAMKRIMDIENGNSKDRFRINVSRCIKEFGRHETDAILPGRPLPIPLGPGGVPLSDHEHEVAPLKERKGPDTGSSEVQIAILTAKIRNLANHLERVGNKDKMNKRNLRLLVHRRQGLLQYLRRRERAGPRWQRCIDTLGLTEGTWRGEITL